MHNFFAYTKLHAINAHLKATSFFAAGSNASTADVIASNCRRNQVQQIGPALQDMEAQFEAWGQKHGAGNSRASGATGSTRSGKRKVQGESSIDPGETSTKALKAVGTGLALGAPAAGKNASFEVEKVLDARADKHGKLIEAKVSWAPTWEPAKNLTEVTVKEAYSLLFG